MVALSRSSFSVLVLAVLFSAAGCGKSTLPKTYSVAGTVVYQGGQPVTGGSVHFISAGEPPVGVIGEIRPDGAFTLRTIKDNEQATGAPAGDYQVTVRPAPPGGNDSMAAHIGVAEIKLATTYKVEPTANNFKIELPGPPPS